MINKINVKKAAAVAGEAKKPLGQGLGRRKTAVARAQLWRGSGKIVVNGRELDSYFDTSAARTIAQRAFAAWGADSLDAQVNVFGGGLMGQAGATSLALARALLDVDPERKKLLRDEGLVTRDSRSKERKKPGRKAARRSFQFVKR